MRRRIAPQTLPPEDTVCMTRDAFKRGEVRTPAVMPYELLLLCRCGQGRVEAHCKDAVVDCAKNPSNCVDSLGSLSSLHAQLDGQPRQPAWAAWAAWAGKRSASTYAVVQQAGMQAHEQRQRVRAGAEDPACKPRCGWLIAAARSSSCMFEAEQGHSCFQGVETVVSGDSPCSTVQGRTHGDPRMSVFCCISGHMALEHELCFAVCCPPAGASFRVRSGWAPVQ